MAAIEDRIDGAVEQFPDGDVDGSAGIWCETASARAVIGAAIGSAVDQLDRELPRARLGSDPEGVHQARVATRRLRSDLRTFGPLLDDHWRDRTRAELQWPASALAAVRDTDVLGMRLDTTFRTIGVDPQTAATVLDALHQRGADARRTMIEVLGHDRAAALMGRAARRDSRPAHHVVGVGAG